MGLNTVLVKGFDTMVREDYAAQAAITPGHLIERTSTGTVQKHSTAGGKALVMFAGDNKLVGKDLTVDFAASDNVPCFIPMRGAKVNALVAAAAAAIVVGDFLESAGDGTLRKVVAPLTDAFGAADGTIADVGGAFNQATLNNNFADIAAIINGGGRVIAQADVAVDNSGGGAPARIIVRIL